MINKIHQKWAQKTDLKVPRWSVFGGPKATHVVEPVCKQISSKRGSQIAKSGYAKMLKSGHAQVAQNGIAKVPRCRGRGCRNKPLEHTQNGNARSEVRNQSDQVVRAAALSGRSSTLMDWTSTSMPSDVHSSGGRPPRQQLRGFGQRSTGLPVTPPTWSD